jgi:photosystem II stability/assembly factor-like uncharacterized protein
MKCFLLLILSGIVLLACHKNNSNNNNNPPPPPPPPPVPSDTLSTGWSRISVAGNPSFYDIFFANNTGFAISNTGIYRSVNSGSSWSKITGSGFLYNIGMGSDTNAIIVLFPNKLICTHNGGITLDTVTLADNSLSDVFFISPTIAYAVGISCWKTTNGGYSWTKLSDFAASPAFLNIHFLNEQTGWVMRKEGLFKTTNGGLNWQLVNVGTGYNLNYASAVFFVNSNHGLFSDDTKIASTINGGTNWSTVYTGKQIYHDIHFLSDNVGYITDSSRILKTTDGGMTWSRVVGALSGAFIEIHFKDANHGWACGLDGAMFKYEQ